MTEDSRKPVHSSRPWFRVFSVLFIACAAFAGSGLVTWAYHLLAPAPKPIAAKQVEVRGTSTIITAIRDLAVLETSSYHVERVIDLRERQSQMFGFIQSEDAILLVAAADVVAGVDLRSMQTGDVRFDPEARTAYITLPRPVVLSARLDNERTYVHTRKTDALAKREETLETRARKEAERTLREAAVGAGILDRAGRNAVHTIETLVRSLGFTRVEVGFRAAE